MQQATILALSGNACLFPDGLKSPEVCSESNLRQATVIRSNELGRLFKHSRSPLFRVKTCTHHFLEYLPCLESAAAFAQRAPRVYRSRIWTNWWQQTYPHLQNMPFAVLAILKKGPSSLCIWRMKRLLLILIGTQFMQSQRPQEGLPQLGLAVNRRVVHSLLLQLQSST